MGAIVAEVVDTGEKRDRFGRHLYTDEQRVEFVRQYQASGLTMAGFPAAIRIYVAVQPVDLRKQFNGLWAAVSELLHEDPKSGAVFAFINRDRTRLKLLYWDGTGVWVLAKRLEQGRFSWPTAAD